MSEKRGLLRRLRGGQPASYAITTMVVLFALELAYVAATFAAANVFLPQFVALSLQSETSSLWTYFVHGSPDREAVVAWLDQPDTIAEPVYQEGSVTVIDEQGVVITSRGYRAPRPGSDLAAQLAPATAQDLRRVLAGGPAGGLWDTEPGGALVVMAPILAPDHHARGALVQRVDFRGPSLLYWLRAYGLYGILPSLVVIPLIGCAVGLVFGSRNARRLRRRFARLSRAVEEWGRGDFSRATADEMDDEIGQLARGLDRMAEQLRDLLRTRQELAMLEERSRLARDLHDSVKQQVFAASMQVSAARALLDGADPQAAGAPLADAERLVRQAQLELTSSIGHLRPVDLEGRTLAIALQDHVAAWARRTAITATTTTSLDPDRRLPADVEEALLRVAQEALANVARHSGATMVTVSLGGANSHTTLSVADDGRGMDPAAAGVGVGLSSMRERAEAVGGTFRLESSPGAGTTVTVSVERKS